MKKLFTEKVARWPLAVRRPGGRGFVQITSTRLKESNICAHNCNLAPYHGIKVVQASGASAWCKIFRRMHKLAVRKRPACSGSGQFRLRGFTQAPCNQWQCQQ